MNDIEKAISDISDIRSRMAASTRFRGYAPEAVAVIGMVSLLVMAAQLAWPDRLAASDRQQVLVWGTVLLASGLTVGVEAIARSRHEHGGMAGSMLQGAMRIVVPVMLVSAAIALAVLAYAPEATRLLPGAWQMLIGVVAWASYPTMPRGIVWPALWYLGSGAGVMLLAGNAGALSPLLCGGPLVVGHLAIAWVLYREGGMRA